MNRPLKMLRSPRAAIEASIKARLAATSCKRGHPFVGDNLYINPRGNRECRTCRNANAKRERNKVLPSEDMVRSVFSALHEGKTLSFITHGRIAHGKIKEYVPGAAVVRSYALKNFIVQNPKAARIIKRLAEKNRLAAAQGAQDRRSLLRREALAPAIIRSAGEDAFKAIMAATAALPDHLRGDVQSLMFVAHAEGRLKMRDAAKRVREFVTMHNREFSAFVPVVGGRMQSLDQQVYEDGPTRLIDTVTRGLWG